jgi:cytochrome c553
MIKFRRVAMLNKYIAGVAAIAIAIAIAFTVAADAGNGGKKRQEKGVQAQMSSCGKCNKRQQMKDCNNQNCDKKKAGEPCPPDCPKRK